MSASIAVLFLCTAAASAISAIRGVSDAELRSRLGASDAVPAPTPRRAFSREDVASVVAGCAAGWMVARVPGLVLGVGSPWVVRRVRARRAARVQPLVVEERTADAIGALAAAVRSGSSLAQALRYAAYEAPPPVSDELQGVVADLDTGVALDHALKLWADRRRSADTDLLSGALELHRRSGGDLPAVLDQCAGTIRDRVSVAREVRSLTAQARLSAWILGLLPVGFFAFLWVTSRHEIEGALTTPVGLVCVGMGLVLEGGAFLWIRSLLEVG